MTSAERPPPISRRFAGRTAAELFARVRDHVQCAHYKAGTVSEMPTSPSSLT